MGTSDTALQQSKLTKSDFNLFNFLKHCGRSVFILGPIPTVGRGAGRFNRLLSLHGWLQSTCRAHHVGFIYNFNLFWDCLSLFNEMEFILTNQALKCWLQTYSMRCSLLHVTDCLHSTHPPWSLPLFLRCHLSLLFSALAPPTVLHWHQHLHWFISLFRLLQIGHSPL